MNEVLETLAAAQHLEGEAKKRAYADAVEQAKRLFPDFAGATERHQQQLQSDRHVSPLEKSDGAVFEAVFAQVPGLSRAYGAVTAPLHATQPLQSYPEVPSLPDQCEYWGHELRFDSDLGRQI